MNGLSFLFWGFIASVAFLTFLSTALGFRLTRINFPFILGTFFTSNRNWASLIGILSFFLLGWIFALIYILGFYITGVHTLWLGLIFGFIHGSFFLSVGLTYLPYLHPRMAQEEYGPSVGKMLEPPGFLGVNYGYLTPLFVLIGHLIYGVVIGLYTPLS